MPLLTPQQNPRTVAHLVPPTRSAPTSPGCLLVMVCDAALRYLLAAESDLRGGCFAPAAAAIRHAQSILVEMQVAVDRAAAPDIADAFTRVCQHLIDRLFDAIAAGDADRVQESRLLLGDLRDAWARATGMPPGYSGAA